MNTRSGLPMVTLHLGLLITSVAIVASSPSARGIPWSGELGITETLEQIMARAPVDAPARAAVATHPRFVSEAPSAQNPLAPLVSQWPPTARFGRKDGSTARLPQSVATSFQAATLADSGAIPPDSMGAVGPAQVLVVVNGRVKLFNKSGGSLPLNTTTDSFFASVRNGKGTSDPHVRYDRLSGRWFIVMINIADHSNRILIAVSSGATITNATSFTFFQFVQDFDGGDSGLFADYPTLGVGQHALYIGVNNFLSSSGGIVNRAGFVVNKASLISGGPIVVTAFRNLDDDGQGNGMKSPQGVDNDDPEATEGYFIGTDLFEFGKLDVRRISDPGGTPAISPTLVVTVPATSRPIPQSHRQDLLGKKLDALDDRLFAAAIHKNKLTGSNTLWTAHNIEVDTNGLALPGGGRNGSRWYEIGDLTGTPILVQAGTLFDSVAANPRGFWMPSVAMSGQGHMALGCSYAGTQSFAGVAVAGRLRSDPAGATQAATLAVVSANNYNVDETGRPEHRWGDFSQTVVDPTDDMTMWAFQEYCNANNSWAVRVVQLRAPGPATPVSASPSTLTAGQSNVDVTITANSVGGSEFFDPGPDPSGPGFLNHISPSVGAGVTVNSVIFSNITNITMNVTISPCAAPGPRTVTVINPDGRSASSASAILTILSPPCISAPPQDQTVTLGADAPFTVTASGDPPLSYQWRFNQLEIPGATNTVFTRVAARCADAGDYDVVVTNALGSATSSVANLTVASAPSIATQPASQTINAGQTAIFTVGVTNECGDPVVYQWRFQGTNIPGANAATYVRTNAQFIDGGDYVVVAGNLAGSLTSAVATLTILSPPLILQPPQNQTLSRGTDATNSVTAIGTAPLRYQWRFNQADIADATNAFVVRQSTQCSGAGGYDVVVTNAYGSVTSGIATLTVVAPPGIAIQPTNQTIFAGQAATFIAIATNECGGGFSYQWRFDGTNLPGASTNSLTITNALPTDAGNYALVVTNIAGSTTSVVATLTVIAPTAAFVAGPTNGFVPLTVFFTNESTSATEYRWDFGDGNASAALNPTNTYLNAGVFSVTLAAIGQGVTNRLTRTNYIVVSNRPVLVPLAVDGTNLALTFATISGRTYVVQFKDSLADTIWQTLQTVPGDGTVKAITNSTFAPPQRFYRLNVQ